MAGATFSRNGNAAYVRARATPVNPRTSSQTISRDRLNAVATAWRALTQPQRNSWIALAPSVPYVNSLGDTAHYSGFQLFMKCNLVIQALGNPFITNAPSAAPTFPAMPFLGIQAEQDSATFSDFTLAALYGGAADATGMTLVYESTGAYSAGKRYIPKSDYRKILSTDPIPAGAPQILTTQWEGRYGTPAASLIGTSISVRARFVDLASGFVSPWVEQTTIVTEA